jgi:hypothetical protein
MIMATKALPAWMCNVAVPMDRREAAILGKAYYDLHERSRAELMRKAILLGLEQMHAVAAAQIKAVREENLRLKTGMLLLFMGMLAIGAASELRRSPRGRRIEQEEVA